MSNKAVHPCDLGLRALGAQLRDGSLTPHALVEASLERIDERNGGEPTFDGALDAVNAWARVDRDAALQGADEAARRLESGDATALTGIPVGVKDLFAVAGKPLTASSRVREHEVAAHDSAAWAALDAAGAIYLGHTHTHEFAAGGTTDQVGNPWNLRHSAGGSSGGSGAAVASGMVPLALGTDTAGSVRIPAALSGVSAFKPSYGRVPLDGVVPLASTFDHVGPIAVTIDDCAVALEVLSGARGAANPFGIGGRLAIEAPTARDLRGVRIALTDRPALVDIGVDDDVLEGYDRARALLEQAGATIVELPHAADFAQSDYDTILIAEARSYHARHAEVADRYRPSTAQFLSHGAEPFPVDVYLAAQARRLELTAAWSAWFDEHDIDALLEPTAASTAPERGHGYDADQKVGGTDPLTCFTATWNATGFPVAALPSGIGTRSGLPVSVQLVGPSLADRGVLEIAIALQERMPVQRPRW